MSASLTHWKYVITAVLRSDFVYCLPYSCIGLSIVPSLMAVCWNIRWGAATFCQDLNNHITYLLVSKAAQVLQPPPFLSGLLGKMLQERSETVMPRVSGGQGRWHTDSHQRVDNKLHYAISKLTQPSSEHVTRSFTNKLYNLWHVFYLKISTR